MNATEHHSVMHALRYWTDKQPQKLAVQFLEQGDPDGPLQQLSYAELWLRACVLGAWLRSMGQEGRPVLLSYGAGLEFVSSFFGCLAAGAIAVPGPPPEASRGDRALLRLRAIVRDTNASLVLTDAREALEGAGIDSLSCFDSRAIASELTDRLQVDLQQSDVAFLQYSSGSTGDPKGVMVTHGNLLHNSSHNAWAFQEQPANIKVGWLPMFHDMGLIGHVVHPLCEGMSTVLLPTAQFLKDPLCWLRAISRHERVTSGAPNFGYQLCADQARRADLTGIDLRGWRLAYCGAEPVRAGTLLQFERTFRGVGFNGKAFHPCYGLAEATLIATGLPPGESARFTRFDTAKLEHGELEEAGSGTVLVGCGAPDPHHEVRIVDPETREALPEGRIGEVWLSGPSVAAGYWQQPELTEATFRARIVSEPGAFLRTGDLAGSHEGHIYITGRVKDLIIVRGRNLYPHDVEYVVERAHASLRPAGACAFSIVVDDQEVLGVAIEQRQPADAQQRRSALDAVRLAVVREFGVTPYVICLLKPRGVPKTSSGKVQRAKLRADYLRQALDATEILVLDRARTQLTALTDAGRDPDGRPRGTALREEWSRLSIPALREECGALVEAVARATIGLHPDAIFDRARSMRELGMDSVMAVEARNRLFLATGVEFAVSLVFDHPTIEGIVNHVLSSFGFLEAVPLSQRAQDDHTTASNQLSADQLQLLSDEELQAYFGAAFDLDAVR